MTKPAILLLTAMLALMVTAVLTVKPVSAQPDLNAVLGSAIDDSRIDGALGDEWSDAANQTGVAINPHGTAAIWTKHDGANLYIALTLTADSSNPWVSIMFRPWAHMANSSDGALFGHDEFDANGYVDIFFGGIGRLKMDEQQDGKGAVSIDSQNRVTVELKKPLDSGDQVGNDVNWKQGTEYSVTIMWDSNGDGSSGGRVSHYGGNLTDKTILINANSIPELTAVALVAILTGAAISAILLKKRLTQSATASGRDSA